jgi:hypothetical protein
MGLGYFRRNVNIIPFSSYSQITVEVCFSEGIAGWFGPLYGTGTYTNAGTIAEVINGVNGFYTIGRVGNKNGDTESNGKRDFIWTKPTGLKFTTHTTVYSCISDPAGRQTFIDGIPVQDSTKNTETIESGEFRDSKLLLGSNGQRYSNWPTFRYAAVRIYGRKLNADEIAKNALTDQLIYNS